MRPTILFTGGGTLGSVTPLLAVSQTLQQRRPAWVQQWVGTIDGPERQMIEPHMTFHAIPAVKLRRYWSWATVADILRAPFVYRQAKRLVAQVRPTVIVGAGGYVSVPIGLAGHRAGAKLLIHQQDLLPGLANRILARWADRITVATQSGQAAFPAPKTSWTGNPTRFDPAAVSAARGRQMLPINPSQPLVLVLGGGTGAEALNDWINHLRPELASTCSIVHLTGPRRGRTAVNQPAYISRPFLTSGIGDLMAAADIVVTRAGMGTLTELSTLGKAAIVVPMPKSHQEANADALELQSAAVVVRQSEPAHRLREVIQALLQDSARRQQLGRQLHDWNKSNAAATITTLIEELAQS